MTYSKICLPTRLQAFTSLTVSLPSPNSYALAEANMCFIFYMNSDLALMFKIEARTIILFLTSLGMANIVLMTLLGVCNLFHYG